MVTPQDPQVTSMELLPTSFDSGHLTGPHGETIEHHRDLIRPKSDLNWPQNDYDWFHSYLMGLPMTPLGSLGRPSYDFFAFLRELSGPQSYLIGLSSEIIGPLFDILGPVSDLIEPSIGFIEPSSG